jgi:hypothetical protein
MTTKAERIVTVLFFLALLFAAYQGGKIQGRREIMAEGEALAADIWKPEPPTSLQDPWGLATQDHARISSAARGAVQAE